MNCPKGTCERCGWCFFFDATLGPGNNSPVHSRIVHAVSRHHNWQLDITGSTSCHCIESVLAGVVPQQYNVNIVVDCDFRRIDTAQFVSVLLAQKCSQSYKPEGVVIRQATRMT